MWSLLGVPGPAAGFPALTASVADHLATVGRLERAAVRLEPGSSDVRELGSAEEAAMWRDRISVDGVVADAVAGRAVLLVVDATSTLWPVTVAAAALRRSGSGVVLPLVLHRRP